MTSVPPHQRQSEQGNIFFYIFLGIALFAALGYAMSRNTISTSSISNDKAKLLATEIISQANSFNTGISKIRLKGYLETQVSFQNSTVSGYTNANCTVDDCKLFTVSGGGASWLTPPVDAQTIATDWGFSGSKSISLAASDVTDLVAVLPNLKKEVCEQINLLLNSSGTSLTAGGTFAKFVGSYGSIAAFSLYNFKTSGCIQGATFPGTATSTAAANSYIYVHMLIAR